MSGKIRKRKMMNRKIRNRAVSVGLMLVFFLSACPAQSVLAEESAGSSTYEQLLKGGEAEAPQERILVEISTVEELEALAKSCMTDSWSEDKLIRLEADIVLAKDNELVIPSFGGVFDGNGHRIANLSIRQNGSGLGLFRYLRQGGVIRNLTVEGNISPGGSRSQIGGIVGVNYGKIENCSFSGSLEGDNEIGGIAGCNADSGEIRSCTSDAGIQGNHSAGGIAGRNQGIISGCSNQGAVNTHSTEVTYELEDITLERLEDPNAAANVQAHTDVGGIAGLSEGKIFYCTNSAAVGYQHVGYNIGGIVGRVSQGYVQNCTNTGHVTGRKDTGGIAGQLEPFLELAYLNDNLTRLDRETDTMIDLLDGLHDILSSNGKEVSRLSKDLAANLKNVSEAAGNLMSTGNELWYIYDQELTGMNQDLKDLNQEIGDLAEQDGQLQLPPKKHEVSSGDAWGDLDDRKPVKEDDLESYLAALEKFGENISDRLDTMSGASKDRSGGITHNLEILDQEMKAAADNMEKLTDVLQEMSEASGKQTDDVVKQARVLRDLMSSIRDDLFEYEGITVRDGSDEAAASQPAEAGAGSGEEDTGYILQEQYDTASFKKGKITRCLNQGTVEADTNVGGIAGLIAVEYDLDPEDDISRADPESFELEQVVKAVVRESRNLGEITGKRDFAGGIVGKADFGAVISCESYGAVTSVNGSYVGGIAGLSDYAVRSCYAMGSLSGKNYVGGITGRGGDIFYSCSMVDLETEGERRGAVAGDVKTSGKLYGNYYVEGDEGGIDGIGYEQGAAPLSYEAFCGLEQLPEEFYKFEIIFQADGQELKRISCGYGDSIAEEEIPQIPEKEGCYSYWPEFDFSCVTGSRVLEARYEKWISSLASSQMQEQQPALMAEGQFLPEAELYMTQEGDRITFEIDTDGETYDKPVTVHYLCTQDQKKLKVELFTGRGSSLIEPKVLGSYLVFEMESPGTFRLVTQTKERPVTAYAAAAGGICLFAAVIMIRRKRRSKGKKQKAEE